MGIYALYSHYKFVHQKLYKLYTKMSNLTPNPDWLYNNFALGVGSPAVKYTLALDYVSSILGRTMLGCFGSYGVFVSVDSIVCLFVCAAGCLIT